MESFTVCPARREWATQKTLVDQGGSYGYATARRHAATLFARYDLSSLPRLVRNALIVLGKRFLACALQEAWQKNFADMNPKYIQHVHPALSLATMVLLALAVAGVLLATGLLQ
jgi:hypothetical protein